MHDCKKPFNPKRLLAVMACFVFWCFVISGRLLQFQVIQHAKISDYAERTYFDDEPILTPRGTIYDSQMTELAASVTFSTIVADRRYVHNINAAVKKLAPLLEVDPKVLMGKMTDPGHKNRLILKSGIDPIVAMHIKSLKMSGFSLEDEHRRIYPQGNLASHTLGFVNRAGNGVAGLEQRYNEELKGKPGKVIREVDALGCSYREKMAIPPIPAHSLVLSIDRYIQHFAQTELAEGVRHSGAAAGTAVVMESETGRILALANVPDFDCNRYGEYSRELWRNRAVQDQFEPGSTLKVVTACAALDEGLVGPDEIIDCQKGSIIVGGHRFHDHKPFGLLTFQEILEKSSNIGAIKLALRVGTDGLYRALRSFGFGSRTGIDLPAETAGLLREKENWSGLSIASISFGQEIAVNSIQILVAINAVANGGYRVRPSIVDRVINDRSETIRSRITECVRIMRPETAVAVRNAFEGVILRGTGQLASLKGYRAAGKTGTAQKAGTGGFAKNRYVASFVGFAPLPKPRVTILVQIDEPRGAIHGGEVAAPIFRKITQQTLLRLQVPQDWNLVMPKTRSAPKHPV
jgi:cell division protein FtsI (penicillin-binding protein 3)